jgi:hypothetical protein
VNRESEYCHNKWFHNVTNQTIQEERQRTRSRNQFTRSSKVISSSSSFDIAVSLLDAFILGDGLGSKGREMKFFIVAAIPNPKSVKEMRWFPSFVELVTLVNLPKNVEQREGRTTNNTCI